MGFKRCLYHNWCYRHEIRSAQPSAGLQHSHDNLGPSRTCLKLHGSDNRHRANSIPEYHIILHTECINLETSASGNFLHRSIGCQEHLATAIPSWYYPTLTTSQSLGELPALKFVTGALARLTTHHTTQSFWGPTAILHCTKGYSKPKVNDSQ